MDILLWVLLAIVTAAFLFLLYAIHTVGLNVNRHINGNNK